MAKLATAPAPAPVTDFFSCAPTISQPVPEVTNSNLKLNTNGDLETLAALDYIKDLIASVSETVGSSVYSSALEGFVDRGMVRLARPDNFDAEEGLGTANCQLKKRSSASVLTKEEQKVLTNFNIPFEEVTKSAAIPEKFLFNSELLSDPEMRAKISAALSTIDFGGKSPILREAPVEARKVMVASEASIDACFKLPNREDVKATLKIVTSRALRLKWNGNLKSALTTIDKAGIDLRNSK